MEKWIRLRVWLLLGSLVLGFCLVSFLRVTQRISPHAAGWLSLALFLGYILSFFIFREVRKRRFPGQVLQPSAKSLRFRKRTYLFMVIIFASGGVMFQLHTEYSWKWHIAGACFSLLLITPFYTGIRNAQQKLKEMGETA
jgi:membrane associated rhomboid family serine protease